MQKQKKKFALLFVIFLFNSCGSLPKKPLVEICAHDRPNQEVECFDNQTQTSRTLNIEDTDGYIMFSADGWGLILLYLDRLRRRVRNKSVKSEINKVFYTNGLLEKKINFKRGFIEKY